MSGLTSTSNTLGVSMKPDYFIAGGLWIERRRNREGPVVTYTIWKPNTSRIFTDTKKALKFIAWPKGTPTGDDLRDWFAELAYKDAKAKPTTVSKDQIAAESFGPEAHEEPNENTKMIT